MSDPPFVAVLDSGAGGLNVLLALQRRLPGQAFTYLADAAWAPYGERDPAALQQRVQVLAQALFDQGAQALVLACNTASVVAAGALRQRHPQPVVAMEPAIKPAASAAPGARVLVLATSNTVASASVARLVQRFGGASEILLQACPGLAAAIDRGAAGRADAHALLDRYVRPHLDRPLHAVVLGCTHYAFVADELRRLVGPGTALHDPADAVAAQLQRRLAGQRGAGDDASAPARPARLLSTGDPAALHRLLACAPASALRVAEVSDFRFPS